MHVSQNVPGILRTLSLFAAIIAACVVPAVAQTNGGTQLSPAERAFVINMLQISRGQIALATLTEQRTTNSDAAVSAQQTVAEWCAFRAHLAALAAAAGAPSPVDLSAAQQTMLAELQRTPRSDVMVAAVTLERQGDQMAIKQMGAEAYSANRQISQFVAYARPELTGYDHLIAMKSWSGPTRTGPYAWK